jgi:oligoendopeptidase F
MSRPRVFVSLFALIAVFACAASPDAPEVVNTQEGGGAVLERSEVAEPYRWDLTHFYVSLDDWEADLNACDQATEKVVAMRGKVSQSPAQLVEFLALQEEVSLKLERAYAYTMLVRDQDTRESDPQGMFERARNVAIKLGEASSWYEPEILGLPEGQLMKWCEETPELQIYRHSFANMLRQQEYVLNASEEQLLAMTGKVTGVPRQAYTMLTNADMSFPTVADEKGSEVELSEGRYSKFMQSKDRGVREAAFKGTLGAYLKFKNTVAALLAGSVQGDVFHARARGYESAVEAALSPDNVPTAVYGNLVDTIHEHLPKLHRYMEIRREQLGIDEVHLYDTFVPLVEADAPQIAYDDAVALILTALEPLGEEYLVPMKNGFASRWIDVYETKGKRNGAYSMGIYATHPNILLNYNDTYNEMFTVAHEMGHSMHTWFTQHNQPPIYGDYPIFLAEVASTCNEVILGDYLRQNAKDDAEKLYLVNLELEGIRGTVINQTMWAEYELLLHARAEEGLPLNYESMAEIYRGLVETYFGPSFAYDEEVGGYWTRIPHFYRGFYVYKYATSYCASVALAKRVLSGDPAQLEAYMNFLKAGSSDYPIAILQAAGVDMNTPAPIHATMELFGELLDELEGLLAE